MDTFHVMLRVEMEEFSVGIVAVLIGKRRSSFCQLVGHSMSGSNVIMAAPLLGSRVKSIVLVDTLSSLDAVPRAEDIQPMFNGLRQDFKATMEHTLANFLWVPTSPQLLRDRLRNEMFAVDPGLAIALLEPFYRTDIRPEAAKIQVPVRAINSDMRPTQAAINRKYFRDFDYKVVKGVGHYPMLENPDSFNALLRETLREIG